MSVTLKGAATGNTGEYQYAFVAKGPDNKWTVIKDYSRSNTYEEFTNGSTMAKSFHCRTYIIKYFC